MKSFLSFLFFSLIFSSTYAQTELSIEKFEILNLGDNRLYAHRTDEAKTPLNGKVRIITGYSSEYIEAEFKDGYPVGKWDRYKYNKLAETNNYVDGYKEGEQITYFSDGGTVSERTFLVKGILEGTKTRYYTNGQKEYEITMKNRVQDGPERRYAEDGTLRSETIYKNGKAEGKSFTNYISNVGDYLETCYYKDGKRVGEYSEVSTDGTVKVKGTYKNGEKDGIWNKYDDGIPTLTEEYKNGERVKKISYYTNGSPEKESNYKNDREDGVVKEYKLNGTIKSEKNYVNGKQVGKQTQYYTSNAGDYIETCNYSATGQKDGEYTEVDVNTKQTTVKGSYLKGMKNGVWTYRKASGKIYKEELYDNGVRKESKDFD